MLNNSNCDFSTIKRPNAIGSIVSLRPILGPMILNLFHAHLK